MSQIHFYILCLKQKNMIINSRILRRSGCSECAEDEGNFRIENGTFFKFKCLKFESLFMGTKPVLFEIDK